jgi:hypothetical protein
VEVKVKEANRRWRWICCSQRGVEKSAGGANGGVEGVPVDLRTAYEREECLIQNIRVLTSGRAKLSSALRKHKLNEWWRWIHVASNPAV